MAHNKTIHGYVAIELNTGIDAMKAVKAIKGVSVAKVKTGTVSLLAGQIDVLAMVEATDGTHTPILNWINSIRQLTTTNPGKDVVRRTVFMECFYDP